MIFWLILSTVLHLVSSQGTPATYSYSTKDNWPQEFPLYCAGQQQSPIDITTPTVWSAHVPPLYLDNYLTAPTTQNVTNNFHSLTTTGQFKIVPTIYGGGLPYTYEFENLHFHWGSDDSKGSEHTVDGYRFPLEMHILHKRQGYTLDQALQDKHGLAVLSVLFQVSQSDNAALAPLLEAAGLVTTGGASLARKPVAPGYLLPQDLQSFYIYEGSLTTPVCNEAVIWTVFAQTVPVSSAQLRKFRTLKEANGSILQNNFRNTQPRNGRWIFSSF